MLGKALFLARGTKVAVANPAATGPNRDAELRLLLLREGGRLTL